MNTTMQINDIIIEIDIIKNGAIRIYYTIYDGKDIIKNWFVCEELHKYMFGWENMFCWESMFNAFLRNLNIVMDDQYIKKSNIINDYLIFLNELEKFFDKYVRICCGL